MHRAAAETPILIVQEKDGPVACERLTLRSPGDNSVLVANLDVEIPCGTRVLIHR